VSRLVCTVRLYKKPRLNNPILVYGLPGIGLVANIAVAHLIDVVKGKLFGEISCSTFQGISVVREGGKIDFPMIRFYYYKGREDKGERDLVILYGNTQATTSEGQYELCLRILDVAQELGCSYILTLGGYKPGRMVTKPKLYFAASDLETATQASSLGAEILKGRVFGVAGLLIGLGIVQGIKGFCLLAETSGTYPDEEAAKEVLRVIPNFLSLKIDFAGIDVSAERVKDIEPFNQFTVKK